MTGFVNQGLFTVESNFDDVEKRAKAAAEGVERRVGRGMAKVFSDVERDLQDAIREHPAWDSGIADRTSVRNVGGAYEVAMADERVADLETGRDPLTAPSPIVGPLLRQRTADIEDRLSAVITRGVGL